MKLLNRLLLFMFATTLIVACDDEEYPVLNPSAETVVSLSSSDVVLDKDNLDADVLTVSWSEPAYGFEAAPSYRISFTYADLTEVVNAGSALSKTFTTSELNKILLNLGFEGGVANQTNIKVDAVLSSYKEIASSSVTLTATAFEDKLDLSTIWGVVGSATPNGWDGPDVPFYKTSEADVLVAYPTLTGGEIKFRTNNAWDFNYGDSGLDGTLDEGGDNIPVNAGTYKITLDLTTLTYTIEEYAWGLVGSATTNGWDGPDMPLQYDPFSDTWKALVELATGEIKVRQNNDWGVNYGDNGSDGVLDAGGDNIPVNAGTYLVTVDFKTFEYSIKPTFIWGIVGSAAPNGWDGPDVPLNLSFEKDDFWYINGVTLADGEMKFRANNSWDNNFGDTGLDGVLDNGGDNIPVSAGTYNITIDFADPNAPVWTIQ